jgi:glycosyltransferase 2 family protein
LQDAHNGGRKGHLSLIARVAVATAAILWVLRGQDWRELAAVLRNLSLGYFSLSLAVYASAEVIIAIRWWLLLRAQSIHIEVSAAVRLFFLGLFYNNVMPGSVGGDLLKAWYVTKHTERRLEGVLSVFVDRAIGLAGLVLIAIATYLVLVRGHIAAVAKTKGTRPPGWLSQHPGAILGAGVAFGALLVVVLVHPTGRAGLARLAGIARLRGVSLLRRAKDAIVVYCSKLWTLLGTMVLTLIGQSITIIAFWLLGRDLGIEAGLRYYFFVFPVVWVVGAVPISIAGLGIVEAGTVGLLCRLTGAPAEKVLVLVFCQRFVWVLASLPGGMVHLLGAHLPQREISIDAHLPGSPPGTDDLEAGKGHPAVPPGR